MDVNEAVALLGADLRADALSKRADAIAATSGKFQPASPLEAPRSRVAELSPAAANDYRLDLALQNLLAIGAEFSPDDIIGLRRRARFGDPRWLYSLYDEIMRLGPSSQTLKAKEALKTTQTIWHAQPEDADEDENSSDPEDKAARLIRDVTEEAWAAWLPDLKMHLSSKFFYGIAAVQVMWRPKAIENRWSRITDIRPIPARRFRLDPQTMRFKFLANPFSWEGPFVDDLVATGKMIFVESGADTEPLDQRGLFFQCLIAWAIEQFTVRWRAKRLQNFGMPPVMVTYPEDDPNNKAVAELVADLLANGSRAAIPDSIKAELLTAAGSGSKGGDPYESNIEWCDRHYDKVILGHSQVSGVQVGAGSRTSSSDAVKLFKDVTNSRAEEIDGDIFHGGVFPYVAREFGITWAENHAPRTESSVIERDDPKELSEVANNLKLAGAGEAIAAEDLVQRCSLKVSEDGELTLNGNIKGEEPAVPPMLAPAVGPDGRPVPVAAAQPGQSVAKPGQPVAAPAKPAQPAAAKAAADKKQAMATLADVQSSAAYVLRRRRGKKAVQEFYSRRQRFAAASVIGGRPRIILTTFGHEYGTPDGTSMNFDVRTMSAAREYPAMRMGNDHEVRAALEAHPMTGAIYGGVKSRVQRAIEAGKMTGDTDMNFGIGCEHGKHRAVYVGERLRQDLLRAGHDVTIVHRDAMTKSGERGLDSRMFATHLELVPARYAAKPHAIPRPAKLLTSQAKIAARVRARLKHQLDHALDQADAANLSKG
jgi:phage gp29-like protein